MPTVTMDTLEDRVAALTAQVAKLTEADVRQRSWIIRMMRYLREGVANPRQMRQLLIEAHEVLGPEGLDGLARGRTELTRWLTCK